MFIGGEKKGCVSMEKENCRRGPEQRKVSCRSNRETTKIPTSREERGGLSGGVGGSNLPVKPKPISGKGEGVGSEPGKKNAEVLMGEDCSQSLSTFEGEKKKGGSKKN